MGIPKGYFKSVDDQEVRDFMYADGTVHETLQKMKLIGPGVEPSSGVACIESRYESILTGSVIDFAATSLLVGGVAIKLFRTAKYASGAGTLRKMATTLNQGMYWSFPTMLSEIKRSCGENIPAMTQAKNADQNSDKIIENAIDLPIELGFKRSSYDDENQNPACQSSVAKNFLLQNKFSINCATNLGFAALSLPWGKLIKKMLKPSVQVSD